MASSKRSYPWIPYNRKRKKGIDIEERERERFVEEKGFDDGR